MGDTSDNAISYMVSTLSYIFRSQRLGLAEIPEIRDYMITHLMTTNNLSNSLDEMKEDERQISNRSEFDCSQIEEASLFRHIFKYLQMHDPLTENSQNSNENIPDERQNLTRYEATILYFNIINSSRLQIQNEYRSQLNHFSNEFNEAAGLFQARLIRFMYDTFLHYSRLYPERLDSNAIAQPVSSNANNASNVSFSSLHSNHESDDDSSIYDYDDDDNERKEDDNEYKIESKQEEDDEEKPEEKGENNRCFCCIL